MSLNSSTLVLPLVFLLGYSGCKSEKPQTVRDDEKNPVPEVTPPSPDPTAGEEFGIFADGKPLTAIVLSESAKNAPHFIGNLRHEEISSEVPNDIVRAVNLFRRDLMDGYGVDIPLGETANVPNRIEIDLIDTPLDKEDETEVSFPASNVMRIRGGQSGIIRTLFFLLEKHAGVRYLFQGAMNGPGIGVDYPKLASLSIPRETFTRNSAFPLDRSSSQTTYGSHWEGNQNRLYWWNWSARLGAKARVPMDHTLTDVAFPLEKYAKDEDSAPKEVFPIQEGTRLLPWRGNTRKQAHWQPDYDNPATLNEAVKNILAHLEAHPNTVGFSLGVNDNGGFSDPARGRESESYYTWVNAVADQVGKKYPHVFFGVAAYREVEAPPKFPLHPNVVSFITFDFQTAADPEVKARKKKLIEAWQKAGRFGVYSYNTGDTTYTLPRIYFREMKEMIQFLHQHGAASAFTERSYTTATEGPKMYLYEKLLEDPDLDLEATITDWCESAVGKSVAVPLRQYYAFWEDFWRTKAVQTNWWKSSKNNIYLSLPPFGAYMNALEPGDMAKCRKLMEEVVNHAQAYGTPAQKKRADFLMDTFTWYEANATASGGEFFEPDGTLPDAATAAAFIQNIPKASAAFERSLLIPHETKEWLNPAVTTKDLKSSNPVIGSLAAVGDHLSDPGVIAELQQLAINSEVSPQIRFLSGLMAKSAEGSDSDNMAQNGSLEADDQGWNLRSPVHGSIERSAEVASHGTHSLKCAIKHSNFETELIVPNGKPGTDYYLSARIFIPATQAVAEGRVNIWGQGIYEIDGKTRNRGKTRNVPDLILTPGQWNYISATIPGDKNTEALRAGFTFKRFEEGDVAYIDDVRVYEIPSAKTP